MTDYYESVTAAADHIRSAVPRVPDLAVVLGSGLGDFAGGLASAVSLPYATIPHWPRSSVPGHSGKLIAGRLGETGVAVLAGRAHLYEGYSPREATFPIRVLGLLGIRALVLTNAAGGINRSLRPGQLVLISDHINLQGANPLIGENDDRFGPRFPDLSEIGRASCRERV